MAWNGETVPLASRRRATLTRTGFEPGFCTASTVLAPAVAGPSANHQVEAPWGAAGVTDSPSVVPLVPSADWSWSTMRRPWRTETVVASWVRRVTTLVTSSTVTPPPGMTRPS